ncbi:MAG TPA: hypothetical protein VGF84_03755 [Micromonosporaceae bacterium]
MKVAHWAAIVVLILMSLMNLGAVTGDSPAAVVTIGVVVGVAGLIGVYGLIRRTSWGAMTALAAAAAFLLTSVIGLFVGWEGSAIGIGIGVVALVLTGIAESAVLRNNPIATVR